jgi:hypothetical protein
MTSTVFNTNQTAAHVAAFAASHDGMTMYEHMRRDHGWLMSSAWEDDPGTLRAIHQVSHDNEATDPTRSQAHLNTGHTCYPYPTCEQAQNGDYCEHQSCQAIIHMDCPECFTDAMSETGQFDPILCDEHGWTWVTDAGSNSGFAGEGVWWANWACGHGFTETGTYDGN